MGARVVVTGVGVVSSVGVGRDAFDAALRAGTPGIGPLTHFDPNGYRASIAGEAREFRPQDVVLGGHVSRTDAMALAAALEALSDAGWPDAQHASLGAVLGGTTGGMFETEPFLATVQPDGTGTIPAPQLRAHPLSSSVDLLASRLGLHGPRTTVCTACSSGANAIGLGARLVREGRVPAVLAGGADALCRLTYAGFGSLGALAPEPCRPFDRARRGLSLGEGAAVLLLEDLASALARGARPYAELCGWATTTDAHHITNPIETGAGAAEALRRALHDAGVAPDQVDYVNAHGTATPQNDAMEARALAQVFGERSRTLACSSTKGQIGHTLGAAGAIEAAATVLALRGGYVPPTVGLSEPDPACALGHVLGTAREQTIRFALSNSFGFGGNNAVLVFGRPEEEAKAAPRPEARSVVVTGSGRAAAPEEARGQLDGGRARRMDPLSRFATLAAGRAFDDAAVPPEARADAGVVIGSGWGSFDRSAAFMHRVFTRGPRMAEPAEFPNLLQSAAAAHLSIYHRLSGLNLVVAALGHAGDLALATAADEIAAGAARILLAGGAEEHSDLLSRSLAHAGIADLPAPAATDGAALLVLEEEDAARARGARIHARLAARVVASDADVEVLAGRVLREVTADVTAGAIFVAPDARPSVEAAARAIAPYARLVRDPEPAFAAARFAADEKAPAVSVREAVGLAVALRFDPA